MRVSSRSDNRAEACGCTSAMHADRQRAFEAALEQWPTVVLRFDQFCSHLTRLGHVDEIPTHTPAIYLCAACGLGDEQACRVLEATYFPALRSCVKRLDPRPEVVDDVLQQVRDRLLVGPTPRIASYRGEGSLDGWLRAIATNAARDHMRAQRAQKEYGSAHGETEWLLDLAEAATARACPEEETFRKRHCSMVDEALCRSVLSLSSEDRMLLYHYFVTGLGIDGLGRLYEVNRSTAARRILRSVQRIQRYLRKELARSMGSLEAGDIESWVPFLWVDVTADSLLRTGTPLAAALAAAD
jgi:RNA polymerase sigma-70 factor